MRGVTDVELILASRYDSLSGEVIGYLLHTL